MALFNNQCQWSVCLSLRKNDHSNLYFTRQEALLAAISEKDANIALLELSASKKKKTQEEVMALRREKDRLVHQLKQQVGPPRGRHAGWGPGRGCALRVQLLLMAPRLSCRLKQLEPGRRETGRVVAGTAFYCCSGSRACAGADGVGGQRPFLFFCISIVFPEMALCSLPSRGLCTTLH